MQHPDCDRCETNIAHVFGQSLEYACLCWPCWHLLTEDVDDIPDYEELGCGD